MTSRNKLKSLILQKSTDDWLQACEIFEVVKFDGGYSDLDEIRRVSVDLIRELLREGALVVGDVKKDIGFVGWAVSVDVAVDRIQKEWSSVREPTHGDVCWLNLTNKGWSDVAESGNG